MVLGVRDVNKKKQDSTCVEFNPSLISESWQVYEGNEGIFSDLDYGVWYKTLKWGYIFTGEFIGLDLGKEIKLDGIRFVIGRKDKFNGISSN